METEPEPSSRDHQASVPLTHIQCSRCGAWTPKQTIHYQDPRTGVEKGVLPGCLSGCLISIGVFVVLCFVSASIDEGILHLTGASYDPSLWKEDWVWSLGFLLILLSIAGAGAAFPIYLVWRQNRLRNTYLAVRHFVCWQCKHEW